jgi:hypothetical protein
MDNSVLTETDEPNDGLRFPTGRRSIRDVSSDRRCRRRPRRRKPEAGPSTTAGVSDGKNSQVNFRTHHRSKVLPRTVDLPGLTPI